MKASLASPKFWQEHAGTYIPSAVICNTCRLSFPVQIVAPRGVRPPMPSCPDCGSRARLEDVSLFCLPFEIGHIVPPPEPPICGGSW